MPLEAVLVLMDNSEYNRNGDFAPSRFQSQNDAVCNICDAKINSNPENTVGIMSIAGNRPEITLNGASVIDEVLSATARIKINGKAHLFNSIKVAQLALKHRLNKNQRQRVIVFVGHPLEESLEECENLGKRLKMNNVAIDIINFANADNVPKLKAMIAAASNDENCNFLDVPLGVASIADVLFTSPILLGDLGGGQMGAGDGAGGMVMDQMVGGPGGAGAAGDNPMMNIDANLDPELAEAMRLSLMDAQTQPAAAAAPEGGAQPEHVGSLPIPNAAAASTEAAGNAAAANDDDDAGSHDSDYYMRKAMEMSLEPTGPAAGGAKANKPKEEPAADVNIMEHVSTDFMKDLVGDLGLDVDDIEGVMNATKKEGEEDKKEEEKKDGDKK